MNNTNKLFLILFSFLLVAGCVDISIEQKVERDGNSLITQKMDISTLLSYMESLPQQPGVPTTGGLGDIEASMNELCVNATRDEPDISCTYSDGVLELSKTVTPAAGGYVFKKESRFPYTHYILTTDGMPQISDGDPLSGLGGGEIAPQATAPTKFTDPSAKASAASLKLINAKIAYTIEMPGQITNAENGKIEDNKAVYDVIELMEDGNVIEVESQELDVVMVGGAAGVILLVLFVIGFLFLRKPAAPA